MAQYYSYGAMIYATSTLGSIVGAAAIPALGVYGAELFPPRRAAPPTAVSDSRHALAASSDWSSPANSATASDSPVPSRTSPAGPLILVILILVAYPETAHHTLEDLNPEDEPLS